MSGFSIIVGLANPPLGFVVALTSWAKRSGSVGLLDSPSAAVRLLNSESNLASDVLQQLTLTEFNPNDIQQTFKLVSV